MYKYYELIKNSKDPIPFRIKIVKDAKEHGIKPSARINKTSIPTVKKWLNRFNKNGKPGLRDHSKRPKTSPNQIKPYWKFKIIDICNSAKKKNKRINAQMIKDKYTIPYSTNTILKIMREIDFLPQKRKKYQRVKDLRAIKAKLKPFEKIQVDIKYLDDIPEMYGEFLKYRFPKYQITARCVKTGGLFYSYALEKSSTNTTMFLFELCNHLKKCGVDLNEVTIQTDNGTEFASTWNSLLDSAFTTATKYLNLKEHKTIPPGAKTWQSDVETSHRLIEDELYACEEFKSKKDFYNKAAYYQYYFNYKRINKYKGGRPFDFLIEKTNKIDLNVLNFKPRLIDVLYKKYKNVFRELVV